MAPIEIKQTPAKSISEYTIEMQKMELMIIKVMKLHNPFNPSMILKELIRPVIAKAENSVANKSVARRALAYLKPRSSILKPATNTTSVALKNNAKNRYLTLI